MFDPATATPYVAKAEALVKIVTGTAAETPAARLIVESRFGKLVASRI